MNQLLAPLALCLLSLAACGDSGGAGGGGGGVERPDPNLTPDPTGVATSEADACADLTAGIEAARADLGCTLTMPTCPAFVQTRGGGTCLTYDVGTIDACIAHYAASIDCEDLRGRIQGCAFAAIPDSAPDGCDGAGGGGTGGAGGGGGAGAGGAPGAGGGGGA